MPDETAGPEYQSPATPESRREPTIWDPEVERLDEAECWRLISAGGVGRLAYSGRSGLAVLPVGYQVQEGSLLFRIALGSPTDKDLRTGIEGAEYKVAVEIDDVRHGRARRLVRLHPGCRAPLGLRPRSPINWAAGRPAIGRRARRFRAHHARLHRRPSPAPPLTSRQHRQSLPAHCGRNSIPSTGLLEPRLLSWKARPHTTRRWPDLCGLGKPQARADRQINADQNPRTPARARQPCRAFWRGSCLHATIEPGRTFSPRTEFLTFMI
jgi:Pyridoxamine 5'-phosphate oxidase